MEAQNCFLFYFLQSFINLYRSIVMNSAEVENIVNLQNIEVDKKRIKKEDKDEDERFLGQ